MADTTRPHAELDARFSHVDAQATPWADARDRLRRAGIYWISTVRPNGAPHVTPLVGVWHEGAAWFCTGAEEQKGRNLARNPRVALTTGDNEHDAGLDIVIEGSAERVIDRATLERVAAAYLDKYGEVWHFEVQDDAFVHRDSKSGTPALVFAVVPTKILGFRRGDHPAQTRWTVQSAQDWGL